jgi:N-glycosylase/DNA lyase
MMENLRISEWRKLPVSLTELCIDTTLRCGQSFRWKKLRDNEWCVKSLQVPKKATNHLNRSCALHGQILSLKQDSTHLHYRTTKPALSCSSKPLSRAKFAADDSGEDEQTEALLLSYLNLGPDLATLYKQWASVDANFKKRAPNFAGVRILKQDAWEALVGFICSSNNNIVRISQMVRQ